MIKLDDMHACWFCLLQGKCTAENLSKVWEPYVCAYMKDVSREIIRKGLEDEVSIKKLVEIEEENKMLRERNIEWKNKLSALSNEVSS